MTVEGGGAFAGDVADLADGEGRGFTPAPGEGAELEPGVDDAGGEAGVEEQGGGGEDAAGREEGTGHGGLEGGEGSFLRGSGMII